MKIEDWFKNNGTMEKLKLSSKRKIGKVLIDKVE